MNAIVLSIHPKHVKKILAGEKRFEYRKAIPARKVEKIIIYEARPKKMLVAEARVLGVLRGSPGEIWRQTREKSGVSEDFFMGYFEGKAEAFAYQLGEVTLYEPPAAIEALGLKRGPQSFVYVEKNC